MASLKTFRGSHASADTRAAAPARRLALPRTVAGQGRGRALRLNSRRQIAAPTDTRSVASRRAVNEAPRSLMSPGLRDRRPTLSASAPKLPVYDTLPEDDAEASSPLSGSAAFGSLPVVTAAPPPLPGRRLNPNLTSGRVDGFGAEGVPLHSPAMPPVNSATNRAARRPNAVPSTTAPYAPELVALTRPPSAVLTQEAVRPLVLPALYGADGRLVMPAALRGSREVLVHQNFMADQAGLERIRNDDHLRRLVAAHQLIELTSSASLRVNPGLPVLRRVARPWTVHFAEDTARAFFDRFHQPLQLNSAVRSVAYQLRLQRSNGNAAGIDGEAASPHLTGQAIDFGKRGMTLAQLAWMRSFLLPLISAGQIDVEEEFQQACFHISVYRSYVQATVPRLEVAQAPSPGPSGVLRRTRAPFGADTPNSLQDPGSLPTQDPAAGGATTPAAVLVPNSSPTIIEH